MIVVCECIIQIKESELFYHINLLWQVIGE